MKFIVNRFSMPTTTMAINLAGDRRVMKSKLHHQSGLGLVEIMVALAIGIFLVMGLMQMLITSKQSYQSTNHLSQLQEDGRVATHLVVTDLKRAGYMGGNSDNSQIEGSLGQIEPGSSCSKVDTEWGRMISDPVYGLNDTSTGYDCIAEADRLRGDILTIRYATPWIETGALDENRLYIRSSLFRGAIFLGSDEASLQNEIPRNEDNIRELQAFSYYVGTSGGYDGTTFKTCSNQAIPALFRVRLDDSGKPTSEEVLPGVEHFQVRYTDGKEYFDADYLSSMDGWKEIKAVRIWMLIRTICPEADYTDSETYQMGDQSYTPNDNFRRQLYSHVVSIRN